MHCCAQINVYTLLRLMFWLGGLCFSPVLVWYFGSCQGTVRKMDTVLIQGKMIRYVHIPDDVDAISNLRRHVSVRPFRRTHRHILMLLAGHIEFGLLLVGFVVFSWLQCEFWVRLIIHQGGILHVFVSIRSRNHARTTCYILLYKAFGGHDEHASGRRGL